MRRLLLSLYVLTTALFLTAGAWLYIPNAVVGWSNTKSVTLATDEYFDTSDASTDWDGSSAVTWAVWYKSGSTNAGTFFSTLGSSGDGNGYQIFIYSAFLRGRFDGAGGAMDEHGSALSIGTGAWKFLVYKSSGNKLCNGVATYINGSKDGTPSCNENGLGSDSVAAGRPMRVGSRSDGNWAIDNGYIDELTWWNVALSDAEVTELYNSGVPFDPTTHSQAANLAHYWRMGDLTDSETTIYDRVGSANLTGHNVDAGDLQGDVP